MNNNSDQKVYFGIGFGLGFMVVWIVAECLKLI